MPAPEDADSATWLVLVYQLPAKPGALKSLAHRRLTQAGAVYLSPACAIAPAGPAERAMRRMRVAIADAGGTAVLLRATALGGDQQIIAALDTARDREYDDIIARCRDGVNSIGALTEARDFRYEELSQNDARLKRLDARYRAMGTRSAPGAGKARQAAFALARYRSALDAYASSVYATDSAS